MDHAHAAELMGAHFIPPSALAESPLAVSFSEEDMRAFSSIELEESQLLAPDPYDDPPKDKGVKVRVIKDTHILVPIPARLSAAHILDVFGYGQKRKKSGDQFFFAEKKDGNDWKEWVAKQDKQNHPLHYTLTRPRWILARTEPPTRSFNKAYKEGCNMLRGSARPPTIFEALVAMIAYYYWIRDEKKSDQQVKQPFYQKRDVHARLLYSHYTWTCDDYADGRKLTVGLNDASGGVHIYHEDPEKGFGLTGMLPVIEC